MICGNGDTPRYGLDRTGREVCRSCCKTQCTEDPGADLLGYLDGLALGLDEAVLRTVIAEVTGGNTSVTRRLLWDLQNQPGLLTGQAHHHGPKTVLLVNRLHEAGANGVPAPKCPHCDRVVRLSHLINRLRVCGTCYNHAKAEPCKWCGRNRPVAGRDRDRSPDLQHLPQQGTLLPGEMRCLRSCRGRRRPRTADGPIRAVCRKPPVVQCGSCGKVWACLFAWTDSPRCRTCSRKLEPCTDCGRPKTVAARTPRGPICENCWEQAPEAHKPCKQCGTVERLFHFGLCRRCAGDRQLRKLLTPLDGKPRPELDKIVDALLNHNPRRTLLYLREPPTATRLVTDLAAGTCELRDEYMARLERWIERKTASIEDPEDRRLITAYARWDRIARIRRRARGKPTSAFALDVTQTRIAKAITFLAWIKEQGETLATCRQPLIDLWLVSENHQGPYIAGPFVSWAVRSKFASGISVPTKPRRIFHRPLDAEERWAIARGLLHDLRR